MLWLIWIAIMLLTPIVAGVSVWWENRAQSLELPVQEVVGEHL